MLVDGTPYRTVWMGVDGESVEIIDQRRLPFSFEIASLRTTDDAVRAIGDMWVRGAGCIGATAAHGMFLAARECARSTDDAATFDEAFRICGERLQAARPTAVNLAWAVQRQLREVGMISDVPEKVEKARAVACETADEDAEWCRRIGEHGLGLIERIAAEKGRGEPGERADPLQRGLARLRRSRLGHRAHLRRP